MKNGGQYLRLSHQWRLDLDRNNAQCQTFLVCAIIQHIQISKSTIFSYYSERHIYTDISNHVGTESYKTLYHNVLSVIIIAVCRFFRTRITVIGASCLTVVLRRVEKLNYKVSVSPLKSEISQYYPFLSKPK